MRPRPRTVLGFDHGARRIGVAVGQTVTGTASALATLDARDGVPRWDEVAALIDQWQPDLLVVGLPVHMDGTEHARTEAARRFARRLEGRFGLPVELVDERLSSWEAEYEGADNGRGIDAGAARLLLQTWLDQAGGAVRE